MIRASEEAARRNPSSTGHGHFRPWALLLMPEPTRAFRFSHPTLISASADNAYLWDVPTSRLVEKISNIRVSDRDGTLGYLNYVGVNDQYAFICGFNQLRIFARGGGALIYNLTKEMLPCPRWNVFPESNNVSCPSSFFQSQHLHEEFHLSRDSLASNFKAGKFQTMIHILDYTLFFVAQVSASGKDLAVLTASGIFIWIPGFERLVRREASLSDIAVVLNFNPTPFSDNFRDISICLALEQSNEKAAIATVS
jgi:hypothetical protein